MTKENKKLEINTIDASTISKMFLAGAKRLEANKDYINELNVFPVPDGDTGTNMTMTIMSAAGEVSGLSTLNMQGLSKAISSGTLRGARGNSGVILSQLCRGFSKVISNYDKLDVTILSQAAVKAVETAYKAVMKPKEGTILTVAKGAQRKAEELSLETDDIVYFLGEIVKEAGRVLKRTPDMLPVLKQAGVVDSGGQGLVEFLSGAHDALTGKVTDYEIKDVSGVSAVMKISKETEAEIKFGYCTEFIIVLDKPVPKTEERKLKNFLESIGDSIVLVADDEMIKIHVHTNDPGEAITRALTYGSLSRIKIDNMREEHQERLFKDSEKLSKKQREEEERQSAREAAAEETKEQSEPPKKYGFISVSVGDGINEILTSLGVDKIIEGGQTMNPSTEDILKAIDEVNAETVFLFPNNSNIILAANQAKAVTENKEVVVVPTKNVPQGIVSLVNFIEEQSVEENFERMKDAIATVKTGTVTYAVRDTSLDGFEIKENDYMGIGDSGILSVDADMEKTCLDMVEKLVDEDSALVTLYYGEEIAGEEAEAFAEKLEDKYPDLEISLEYGGQPIYYYLVSVE